MHPHAPQASTRGGGIPPHREAKSLFENQAMAVVAGAAVHNYLDPQGGGMEPLSRAPPLPPNAVVEIPLLLLSGVVLFPHETLPLRVFGIGYIRLLMRMASEQRRGVLRRPFLGVVGRMPGNDGVSAVRMLGVVAEILEVDVDWDGSSSFVAKAKGRQRFCALVTDPHWIIRDGVPFGRARILPEDCLGAPRSIPPMPSARRHQSTYWPAWVHTLLSAPALVRRAKGILQSVAVWEGVRGATGSQLAGMAAPKEGHDETSEEEDPVAFSYRLAANLPLTDAMRLQLLSTESVVYRLRLEIALLKHTAHNNLCCAQCQAVLASKRALFSVPGAEGTVGAYCNPHGIVHQTCTFTDLLDAVEAVTLEGEPVKQDSWFDSYAWTIAYCRGCDVHLGWRFTYCGEDTAAGARLPMFWGLRRQALVDEGMPVAGLEDRVEDEDEDDDDGALEEEEDDSEEHEAEDHEAEEEGGEEGSPMVDVRRAEREDQEEDM